MHIRIDQNTTAIEEVSRSTITKLYDLAHSDSLDSESLLRGRVNATATYQNYIDELHTKYPQFYITANKYYLDLEDNEAERIFAGLYGDGIGVTQSDISSIKTLDSSDNLFRNNLTLTNLNCLRYFTGLEKIGDKFAQNCTNLTSVILPNNVTLLSHGTSNVANYGAFRNCTSLVNVTLNEGLEKIYNRCFSGCTSLTTIDIPASVTQIGEDSIIGQDVFSGCTSLQNITGCEGVKVIGNGAFNNCTNLTSFPGNNVEQIGPIAFRYTGITSFDFSNVVSIGRQAFANSKITQAVFSENLTTISSSAFADSSTLINIYIPGTLKNLTADFIFAGCNANCKIKISEGVESFSGANMFAGLRVIFPSTITALGNSLPYMKRDFVVIKATSVPSYASTCFQSNFQYNIYVPDSSVEAYKAQSGGTGGGVAWENRIKPISQFATDFPGISLDGTGWPD